MKSHADEASSFLKALSNPARLLILCELHRGEKTVGALEKLVGLKQSPLSQHLARLRNDGLVQTRRDGVTIHYRLADPRVNQVTAALYKAFCAPDHARVGRLATTKETPNVR